MKSVVSFLLCAIASIVPLLAQHAVRPTFTSPDGRLKVYIETDGSEVRYCVFEDEQEQECSIYAMNAISLQLEGMDKSRYTVSAPKRVKVHFVAPNYKSPAFDDSYNQVVVSNKNGVNVEFRAYDSGIAYRFFLTGWDREWKVLNETAAFGFDGDYTAYLPYSTNTKNPKAMAFQATYDVAPLSQTRQLEAFLPATVDCGKAKVTLFETDVENYPGMFLLPADDQVQGATRMGNPAQGLRAVFAGYPRTFDYYPWRRQKYVTATEDFIAQGKGNRTFPWRVLAVTHDDREMPANTLAYQLASPSRIEGDTAWIRPGLVAWDWWNDWGITGVDWKAGINMDTYRYYIDFAQKYKIPYVILDEGWYDPKSGDMLTTIRDIDLPKLVDYARKCNVRIILWTVFNVLDDQLEAACQKYADMGIAGFKVDFLDRNDQEAMQMIYRIAETCARYRLILDYHGIFAPQGITRTWPNVINFEAVFGMEEVKWTKHDEKDMPAYDVTFPFIRGMVGPVDFTPGGMRNATRSDFQPVNSNPMTMGTRCHQLAMYIIHDSPLTMLADNPTAYEREPEFSSFLASLPTTFDETRVLQGVLGQHIVTARRKGDVWYVAGQTNWEGRTLRIDFDFLSKDKGYDTRFFLDGMNADKNACDYRDFTIEWVTAEDWMDVHLASGGGFLMQFKPSL